MQKYVRKTALLLALAAGITCGVEAQRAVVSGHTYSLINEEHHYTLQLYDADENLIHPFGGVYSWNAYGGTAFSARTYCDVIWDTHGTGYLEYTWENFDDFYHGDIVVDVPVPAPVTSFSVSHACGSTTVTRHAEPAALYDWYWQTTGDGTRTDLGSGASLAITQSQSLLLRARTNTEPLVWSQYGASASFSSVFSSPPAPGAISGGGVISYGATAPPLVSTALASGSSALQYQWQSSPDGALWSSIAAAGDSPGYSPGNLTITTHFRRKVTGVCGAAYSNIVVIHVYGTPSQDVNYIITSTPLKEVGNVLQTYNLPAEHLSQRIDYFDGIGRPVQSVMRQASPTRKDLVQPIAYDEASREAIKYLPYAGNNSDGRYHPTAIAEQLAFYTTATPPGVAGDSKPYAITIFEPSPLSRVLKQGSPGQVWQPDNTDAYGSGDRTIKHDYDHNIANEVLRWNYVAPAPAYPLGWVDSGNGTTPDPYGPGQLYKNKTKDEHHHEVIEYVDKEGHVVLKKVQLNATAYAETYYVYDDFGSLVCAIPPEAVNQITGPAAAYFGKTTDQKNQFLSKWAFRYAYEDIRRRMSHKQVPGSAPVYMVYDSRDRLVMTQDGNQRAENKWSFTKYDALNRPVVTGIYTHGSTVDQLTMSGEISTTSFYEEYNGSNDFYGYTKAVFPTTNIEVLTVTYYDHYNFVPGWGSQFDYYPGQVAAQQRYGITYIQETSPFAAVKGLVTGMLVKVLGEARWLKTVNYYDHKYRPIQATSETGVSGIQRTTNVCDFTGAVLATKTTVVTGAVTCSTLRRFEYDHAGRLLRTWHSVNRQPGMLPGQEVLLAYNEYNALGQLVTKKLHSTEPSSLTTFRQTIDYRYNIRGWLTRINDLAAPQTDDLFSMELRYNNPTANGGAAQYNGNISETMWSSAGGDKQSYGYFYDPMNRLLEARYSNVANHLHQGRYDERIGNGTLQRPAYDRNGNILNLLRKGKTTAGTFDLMDDLDYSYADGNKLESVTDAVPTQPEENGFREAGDNATDYVYDDNGNMASDANKGIIGIEYNHLNLPQKVSKSTTEYVVYMYDATGRKLAQQVFGAEAKRTDYVGELVYENSVLQFINHEEGRVVMTGTAPEYQYYLKDHLGNVRLTFTTSSSSEEYNTNFESPGSTDFQNYSRNHFDPGDHTDAGTTYNYSQLLTGGDNSQVGAAKSLLVFPGDKVSVEAYAKYVENNGLPNNLSALATAIVNAFSSQPGGFSTEASNVLNSMFSGGSVITPGMWEDATAPKAYINYILFDMDYVPYDFGFDQLSVSAEETFSCGNPGDGLPPGSPCPHEQLFLQANVTKPGYIYIYLSNENATAVDVYFDDLKVTHEASPVVQMDDYYPFGMTFNSYARENSTPQNYSYNGKELQNELSLGWLDYGARMYMPEIGRWGQKDPLADFFELISPFSYAANNPILIVDPDGKENIIYLISTGKFGKEAAEALAASATKILANLGLKTQVRFYNEEKNGKFDASKLDETDNWAVIGNNRKEIAKKTKELSLNEYHKNAVNSWETKKGLKEPEISSIGHGEKKNSGKGISVDYTDPLFNTDKHFSAALSIAHGAGHSAESIKERGDDMHTRSGIMQDGVNLYHDYYYTPNNGGKDLILGQEYNVAFIQAMQERYGTKAAKDNAFKGQVKASVANQTKK